MHRCAGLRAPAALPATRSHGLGTHAGGDSLDSGARLRMRILRRADNRLRSEGAAEHKQRAHFGMVQWHGESRGLGMWRAAAAPGVLLAAALIVPASAMAAHGAPAEVGGANRQARTATRNGHA